MGILKNTNDVTSVGVQMVDNLTGPSMCVAMEVQTVEEVDTSASLASDFTLLSSEIKRHCDLDCRIVLADKVKSSVMVQTDCPDTPKVKMMSSLEVQTEGLDVPEVKMKSSAGIQTEESGNPLFTVHSATTVSCGIQTSVSMTGSYVEGNKQ